IADELTRTVIGDVAAASRLDDLDAARGQRVSRREHVRAAAIAAHAERQDVRVLDEQQAVVDAIRLAILDERALELERLAARHRPEPLHAERPAAIGRYTMFGSHCSSARLT